jgi:hypothetical protein
MGRVRIGEGAAPCREALPQRVWVRVSGSGATQSDPPRCSPNLESANSSRSSCRVAGSLPDLLWADGTAVAKRASRPA